MCMSIRPGTTYLPPASITCASPISSGETMARNLSSNSSALPVRVRVGSTMRPFTIAFILERLLSGIDRLFSVDKLPCFYYISISLALQSLILPFYCTILSLPCRAVPGSTCCRSAVPTATCCRRSAGPTAGCYRRIEHEPSRHKLERLGSSNPQDLLAD